MITTNALLDAAKTNNGITSEYRLCRVIGVSDNTLYNWRHGKTPDDVNAAKLAEMARLDIGYVLASLSAERSKDEGLKAAWAKAAKRLETALPAVFLLILSMLGGITYTPDAHAESRQLSPSRVNMSHAVERSTLYTS